MIDLHEKKISRKTFWTIDRDPIRRIWLVFAGFTGHTYHWLAVLF